MVCDFHSLKKKLAPTVNVVRNHLTFLLKIYVQKSSYILSENNNINKY
jgi:hypothetical protein